MKKILAIAFDLEGPIIDVEAAHHQGHIRAASDVGVHLTIEECFQKIPHFIGGPDEEIAKEIAALSPINPNYKFVLNLTKSHYNKLIASLKIDPRPGFLEAYKAFKDLGLKTSIGSACPSSQANILLNRSGLNKLFIPNTIVLREDVENTKPAPDVWLETAKRTGVPPENQLIFEDSPKGIIGGVAVGAICIAMPIYNRLDTVNALMQAGAKRIFLDWREINIPALMTNLERAE